MKTPVSLSFWTVTFLLLTSCGSDFIDNNDSQVDDHRTASILVDEDGFGLSEAQARKKWGIANSLDCHDLGLKSGELDECKELVFAKNKAQRKLRDFCEHIGFADKPAHAKYRALGCKGVEFSDKEIDKLGDCDVEGKDDDCRAKSRRLYRNFNQLTLNINAYVIKYENNKGFVFDGMKGLNSRLNFLDDAIENMEELKKIQNYSIKAIKNSQLKEVHGEIVPTSKKSAASSGLTATQRASIIKFCKKPANSLVMHCKDIKEYPDNKKEEELKPILMDMLKVMLKNQRNGNIYVYHCKSAFGNLGGEPFIAKNGDACPNDDYQVTEYTLVL